MFCLFACIDATRGWISIGISNSPLMSPADDIVGWVESDGSVTVLDTWSPNYDQVIEKNVV